MIWACPRLPRPRSPSAFAASPRRALRAQRGGGVACFGALVLRTAHAFGVSRPYTRSRCVARPKSKILRQLRQYFQSRLHSLQLWRV